MRVAWIAVALLALAGCGGGDDGSSPTARGETYSAAEVIEAFAAAGLSIDVESDDGCGPSEQEQEELGITVVEGSCSEGRVFVGTKPLPTGSLVPKGPGHMPFSVLLFATAEDAAQVVRRTSGAAGFLRRGNVVVAHDPQSAPVAKIERALDRL